jgi:hypothetical protein
MKQLTLERFESLEEVLIRPEDIYQELLPYLKDVEEELKICTGCGHKSTEPIKLPALGCCPDSNYIPLDEYLCFSVYKPSFSHYVKEETVTEPSKVQVARAEVAEQVLYRLFDSPTVAAGNPIGMVEFAYQCADELIKQSNK